MVTCLTTSLLLILAAYFLYMDVTLFTAIQQLKPGFADQKPDDSAKFSPFRPITIKIIFDTPTIHYIDLPLTVWTARYTGVSRILSGNAASIIGVIFAAFAAKMFLSDSLQGRQIGVFLYKVRDYFDSLDGILARVRMDPNASPSAFGYYFDGVCDGAAEFMLFVAIFIALNRSSKRLFVSKQNDVSLAPIRVDLYTGGLMRRNFFLVLTVAGQTMLSTVMWNFSMGWFHRLLETEDFATTLWQKEAQVEVFKSLEMCIIVYLWRLFNPHGLTQLILLAIMCDKTCDELHRVKYWGYLPIVVVSGMSYVYSKVALVAILPKK